MQDNYPDTIGIGTSMGMGMGMGNGASYFYGIFIGYLGRKLGFQGIPDLGITDESFLSRYKSTRVALDVAVFGAAMQRRVMIKAYHEN